MILGIDEVGRGSWAGPLVVGAVVLGGTQIDGLTDSKKMTKKRRKEIDIIIRESASGFGLGWVPASEIDEIGLSAALRLATIRAVEQVKAPYHEIIIDGTINFLSETSKGKYTKTITKADLLIPSVSAASIIAKVARDKYMAELGPDYKNYCFDRHVGYGTKAHSDAIIKHGITPLHRLSFKPIRNIFNYRPDKIEKHSSTKEIGDIAEKVAGDYLTSIGHNILSRNWKTKHCEIDIVSVASNTVFFTEVKYRKNADQGGGLAVIGNKKLNQMKFAAKLYVMQNQIEDKSMQLSVISLHGNPPTVESYLDIV